MAARGEKERLRIFLAVFPPAAAQSAAEGLIERLRRPDDQVSWVKRDNLHYTLRFLGDLGPDGAKRAADAAWPQPKLTRASTPAWGRWEPSPARARRESCGSACRKAATR